MRTQYYFTFVIVMLVVATIYLIFMGGMVLYFVYGNHATWVLWSGIALGSIGVYVFLRFMNGFR